MNNFGNRLKQFGMNILGAMQRFMAGRYGHDRLNLTLLVVGCVLCFVQLIVPSGVSVVLTILSEALLILSLFRCFSRNTYKRYQENRKYLLRSCKRRSEMIYYPCGVLPQEIYIQIGWKEK